MNTITQILLETQNLLITFIGGLSVLDVSILGLNLLLIMGAKPLLRIFANEDEMARKVYVFRSLNVVIIGAYLYNHFQAGVDAG